MSLKSRFILLILVGMIPLSYSCFVGCKDSKVKEVEHVLPTIEEAGLFTRPEDVELKGTYFYFKYNKVRTSIRDTRLNTSFQIDIPLENLDTLFLTLFQNYLLSKVGLKEAKGIEQITYYPHDESLSIAFDYDGLQLDASIDTPIQNLDIDIVTTVFDNIKDVAVSTYLAPREE